MTLVCRGKKRNKGLEDGANTNDMWVWMRPHIRFCTMRKCDIHFHFFLKVSPASLAIFILFFFMELFMPLSWRMIFFFAFDPCSFSSFFSGSFFCGGEILLARICLRESLDDRIKVETRNEKGCIFGSLWNVGEGK
jgi:hypothetical protein